MSKYAIGVFAVCLISGVATLLSHSSGRMEKVAIGIISLYIIIAPVAAEFQSFDLNGWLSSLGGGDYEIDSEHSAILEDAFAEGVSAALSDKFSFDRNDVRVRVYGFDSKNLRAERIRIILSGTAALCDYKAVERYIGGLGLGECEVEIEIGKK